jgi:hypothetical protein
VQYRKERCYHGDVDPPRPLGSRFPGVNYCRRVYDQCDPGAKAASTPVNILTYHNTKARSGLNCNETTPSLSKVKEASLENCLSTVTAIYMLSLFKSQAQA